MLQQVTRVAERAWQTVEDKLDGANLTQATICAGVATEKMLLLAGKATHRVEVVLADASDLYSEMAALKARLEADCPVIDAEFQSLPGCPGSSARTLCPISPGASILPRVSRGCR